MRMSTRARVVCLVLLLCLMVPPVAFGNSRSVTFTSVTRASTPPLGEYMSADQEGFARTGCMVIRLWQCTIPSMPNFIWASCVIQVHQGRTRIGPLRHSIPGSRLYWRTTADPFVSGTRISGWIECDTRN